MGVLGADSQWGQCRVSVIVVLAPAAPTLGAWNPGQLGSSLVEKFPG